MGTPGSQVVEALSTVIPDVRRVWAPMSQLTLDTLHDGRLLLEYGQVRVLSFPLWWTRHLSIFFIFFLLPMLACSVHTQGWNPSPSTVILQLNAVPVL